MIPHATKRLPIRRLRQVLLALGLVTRFFVSTGLVFRSFSRGSYALSLDTTFFALASLFALFSFLYSLRLIPFDRSLSLWHRALVRMRSS